jgi:alpha-1,3-mannosyltransferase
VLVFLGCTAYRIHSIFVLRLFNDPLAMLLLYAAVYLFLQDRWLSGSALFR